MTWRQPAAAGDYLVWRVELPGVTCGVTGHAQLAHVTRATSADEVHCAVYVNLNIYIAGGGTHQVTVQHLLKTHTHTG